MTQAAAVPPFVNHAMKFVLRSWIHGMVSKSILLISFTGRKSGRMYTTPVSYSLENNLVTIFTHASWWRNLNADTPIRLLIQGREYSGLAEVVDKDKQMIANRLAAHLRKVPSDARYYRVTFDGQGNPNAEAVEKAIETVVMIRVRLC